MPSPPHRPFALGGAPNPANQGLHLLSAAPDAAAAVQTLQSQLPPEGEALPALERSLRREAELHTLVRAIVFGRLMSMLQLSRAIVHSHPFMINPVAIAAEVVQAVRAKAAGARLSGGSC